MIQELITYIIIGLALFYTIYHLTKLFLPNKEANGKFRCNGSSCSACTEKKGL